MGKHPACGVDDNSVSRRVEQANAFDDGRVRFGHLVFVMTVNGVVLGPANGVI